MFAKAVHPEHLFIGLVQQVRYAVPTAQRCSMFGGGSFTLLLLLLLVARSKRLLQNRALLILFSWLHSFVQNCVANCRTGVLDKGVVEDTIPDIDCYKGEDDAPLEALSLSPPFSLPSRRVSEYFYYSESGRHRSLPTAPHRSCAFACEGVCGRCRSKQTSLHCSVAIPWIPPVPKSVELHVITGVNRMCHSDDCMLHLPQCSG